MIEYAHNLSCFMFVFNSNSPWHRATKNATHSKIVSMKYLEYFEKALVLINDKCMHDFYYSSLHWSFDCLLCRFCSTRAYSEYYIDFCTRDFAVTKFVFCILNDWDKICLFSWISDYAIPLELGRVISRIELKGWAKELLIPVFVFC